MTTLSRFGFVFAVLASMPACRTESKPFPASSLDASHDRNIDAQNAPDAGAGEGDGPPFPLDSAVEAGAPWLLDPSLWSRVVGGEPCGLYAASPEALAHFPRRVWTSCGHQGCSIAPAAILPTDVGVDRFNASATYQNGEIYLRIVSGSPTYSLVQITRLSDGEMLAAVQQRGALDRCVVLSWAASSPFLVPFAGSSPGFGLFFGSFESGSGLRWPAKWMSWQGIQTSIFNNDLLWGLTLVDGTVRIADAWQATTLTVVDQGPAPSSSSFGRKNIALWTMLDKATGWNSIRIFLQGAPPKTLWSSASTNAQTVAASDKSIVWIGTQGAHVFEGKYERAGIFWSPFVTRPEDLMITEGPSLPVQGGLQELQTTGDYAAAPGCASGDTQSCGIFVVQLSTKKIWRVPNRSGTLFLDVLAVSDTELLLTEIDWPRPPPQQIRRLVRLSLADLDSIDGGW